MYSITSGKHRKPHVLGNEEPPAAHQGEVVPSYRIHLVRDGGPVLYREPIKEPRAAAKLLRAYLGDPDTEHLVAILLNAQHQPVGLHTVSIGSINASYVRTADVFKAALLANAAAIIVGHNHPSGIPSPSKDDVSLTRVLVDAGNLLEIQVLDHIILGESGSYTSLRSNRQGFDC